MIHGLFLEDGSWCTDEDRLKQETIRYYQALFCHPWNVDISALKLNAMLCLSPSGRDALMAHVMKEEVRVAIMGMKSMKAHGLDGFLPFFFNKY